MITIHRILIEVTDVEKLYIPGFIRALSVRKTDRLQPQVEMWYEVDTSAPVFPDSAPNVLIYAEGTGHPIEDHLRARYIGTEVWEGSFSRLVFHFYVARDI